MSQYLVFYIILLNVLIAVLLMTQVRNALILIGLAVCLDVILVILALHSANLILHPLRKVVETLELNIKGEKKRLEVDGSSEFVQLVDKVNRLLDMRESSDHSLKEAQECITQTQRWILLGKLASGVVHEINNPLDGVINCIHTIRTRPLSKKQMSKYLELVAEGLFRIETITKRLLGLSRDNPLCLDTTDINDLAEKASFFVDYRMTQKRISLRCKFTSDLPLVKVDQGAILQVLVNLYLNAIESMTNGGVLSISTKFDNEWLKIMVADTGMGISEDERGRIFLPFFTTKEDGVGLGLPICQNIIAHHMGEIEVESIVNKGTIFTVKLPLGMK